MISTLPSNNLSLLRSLLSKRIISVKRQLFKGDIDLTDYEQNADGPIEFIMSDSSAIHFIANTDTFSIGVATGKMPLYGDSYELAGVSNNSFWNDRIGREIKQLALLKSSDWSEDYPSEFGVEISFINGKKVLIEYKDEGDCLDMIKVADNYTGQPCIIQPVKCPV